MTDSPCPPLSDADWPEEIAALRDGFAGQLNVYRTMAHHPALLRAQAPLRQHVVKDSALGPIRSEVVILRTGVRLGSSYEWQQHVSRARKLGMSDTRIAAIRDMPVGAAGPGVKTGCSSAPSMPFWTCVACPPHRRQSWLPPSVAPPSST
ncbi:carboxymuconolactone decarboxylase family protein [Ponticoccus litoralis]|uniref:Carboxymuconolactone decarboxylase family protein n=1 Tax=Ponticoccus litoralis TaxID=422297 RepID=A0AAW9SJ08_9RHOB